MKRVILCLLVVILCISQVNVASATIEDVDYTKIETLIDEGKSITNDSSAEAFVWVNKVLSLMESCSNSYVYNDIVGECNSAKKYTSISTFNNKNKIIGYLSNLLEEVNNANTYTIEELIEKGNSISSDSSPEAYKWINDVLNAVEKYPETSVYQDVVSECNNAKKYNSISTFNNKEKIIAYLMTIQEEIKEEESNNLVSEELISIELISPPNKTEYKEGEFFDKEGIVVNATYKLTWSNNDVTTKIKKNVDFYLSSNEKLTAKDDCVIINVKSGEKVLSIIQEITVKSYIVSENLNNILIESDPYKTIYFEGEKFDKAGLVVNAVYNRVWSNGYEEFYTKENVNYRVDETSPLRKSDKTWTVSVIDNGVKKSQNISITVNAKKENKPNVKTVSLLKLNGKKNKILIKWNKVTSISGYQIQISKKKSFRKAKIIRISKSKTSYTKKKLASKKKYFVRIRTYKNYFDNEGNIKTAYSSWKTKTVKTK